MPEWGTNSLMSSNIPAISLIASLLSITVLIGCSNDKSSSAIPASHPASREPSSYLAKHEIVYAFTQLLTDNLKNINRTLSDPSTSTADKATLNSLRQEIEDDLVFAMPFVSNEMDHSDQLQVMHYLQERENYYRQELSQISD